MAISGYIICCGCGTKLIYDGDRSNRDWWKDRWGKEPEIMCPDCVAQLNSRIELIADKMDLILGDNPRNEK